MAKGFEIFFFHFLEDSFQVKNVESIHAWHPEKKNSCNIATLQNPKFLPKGS